MPERKKQHYVPQMYMRLFSVNNNAVQIGAYNIRRNLFIGSTSIQSQAMEDYFYGKDGKIETALGEVESDAAPILRSIVSGSSIPSKTTKEYANLFVFCMILAYRTKDTVASINENINKGLQGILRYSKFREVAEEYEFVLEDTAAHAVKLVVEKLPMALDLKAKIILNKTQIPFITSDNPAVKYNQFLEARGRKHGSTGIVSKGLQIFIPVSPNHMLIFYDDWTYKIGDKRKDLIELTDPDEVNKLNALQYLNCYESLFFNGEVSEQYMSSIVNKNSQNRQDEYTSIDEFDGGVDQNGNSKITFLMRNLNLAIGLKLSFISQTKKAKMSKLSDYAIQFRDESLRNKSSNS